uniref:Uncharacterized protein n=1 Tax=Tetraselmis chuii TaxID=63592 RepID=A0A7S1X9Z9_9CHLO|mmetsp:Transcript_4694/g.8543  ORF Transcript_4694/g.8543 Transcript_4694/m.8543 type:complete len:215 (+) Transcript_4694:3-647(+)
MTVAIPSLVQARINAGLGCERPLESQQVTTAAAHAATLDLLLRCAVALGRAGNRQDTRVLLRHYCAAAESATLSTKLHEESLLLTCRCLYDTVAAASTLASDGVDVSPLTVLLLQLFERLTPSDSGTTSTDVAGDISAQGTEPGVVFFDLVGSTAQLLRLIKTDEDSLTPCGHDGGERVVRAEELLSWATAQLAKAPPSMRPMLDVAVARVGRC